MKRIFNVFLLVFLFLISCNNNKKSSRVFFKKTEIVCENTTTKFKRYKITLVKDSTYSDKCSYGYIKYFHYSDKEKILMIEELLSFKGDTSICAKDIVCYSLASSKQMRNKATYYSIQLEALFMINQIYFDSPFNYASFPVLTNMDESKIETISGSLIDQAYADYKKWLMIVKIKGISQSKKDKLVPLSKGLVHWY